MSWPVTPTGGRPEPRMPDTEDHGAAVARADRESAAKANRAMLESFAAILRLTGV